MAAAAFTSQNFSYYAAEIENFALETLLKVGIGGSGIKPNATEVTNSLTEQAIAKQALELALKGYVEFKMGLSQTTNDTSDLVLSSLGVSFGTGFVRRIDVLGFSADGSAATMQERFYLVTGNNTLSSAVVAEYLDVAKVTSGLATADGSIHTTSTSGAGLTGFGAETVTLLNNSGAITARYTGQSGDATLGQMRIRVYPQIALPLV